jgi:hypothetical protein
LRSETLKEYHSDCTVGEAPKSAGQISYFDKAIALKRIIERSLSESSSFNTDQDLEESFESDDNDEDIDENSAVKQIKIDMKNKKLNKATVHITNKERGNIIRQFAILRASNPFLGI